jgi:calcium-binding protein CML
MGSRVGKQQKSKGPLGIEFKMVKAMKDRGAVAKSSMKSFNSIIMKFSKIDATFEKVRSTFKQFGMYAAVLLSSLSSEWSPSM